ncbi:MAG: hypothetical protein FWC00_02450 [Firmicutes bacterium]|nr:hypothetical protein [Bacillota bacterium]
MSKIVVGNIFKSRQAVITTIVAAAILIALLAIIIPVAINNIANARTSPQTDMGTINIITAPNVIPSANATEVHATHISGNVFGGIYLDFEPCQDTMVATATAGQFFIHGGNPGMRVYIANGDTIFVIILGN